MSVFEYSDRTPNIPKSDSYGALRYRTPNISQTANCLQQRFAIASPHPQKAIPSVSFTIAHPQKHQLSRH
ncbi:MAG: hypothetical protein PT120_20850 [Aphanizomenon gracile PMC649.10]|nr:hypothetical protein [Aphanizomenon gracile PMC649.10]